MKRVAFVTFLLCAAFAVSWHHWGTGQRAVLDCSCTRVLADFEEDRAREALLRHLCASAEWRVTAHAEITPGKKVKRVIEAEQPGNRPQTFDELMQSGYRQVRVNVRFDSSPPSNWKNGSCVLAKAGAKAVAVSLSPAGDDSHTLRSTLVIQGGSLILEIRERNVGSERTLTKKAMQRIAEEFSAVRDNIEGIERDGYLRKWLRDGSVRESAAEPPLEVSEGFMRGIYWVRGYVNPGEKGYVTIRTFHARTGKELDADLNSWRTLQYIGWSSRRNEKFFFECELAAPSYLTEEESKMDPSDPRRFQAMAAEQEIRVEVWFHGKGERKLLEATKVLVPWMR